MTVLICVGTRPEIIKMAPVHDELRQRGVPVAWLHTGQHQDMAEGLYRFFGIEPTRRVALQRHHGGLGHLHAQLLDAVADALDVLRPQAVLVHGDTTSTLASAQAAFYADVPVGHVEAGLRTFDPRAPFPEEKNRELTARLARWHFAPTARAAAHLAKEGIAPHAVHTVGNTAIDAALATCARLDRHLAAGDDAVLPPPLATLHQEGGAWRLVTVTAHRRENWGDGIAAAARAVARLLHAHADLAVVWPVHGNPAVRDTVEAVLGPLRARFGPRLLLLPPLDYPALLWCLRRSTLALTDSGGIQEEGAALSTPVLVLRDTTERPELIEAGAGLLVGTEETRVVQAVSALLADPVGLVQMRAARNPFGDGRTARRVADVLQKDLAL